MSSFVAIGKAKLPGPNGGVTVKIKYSGKRKVDKKQFDGKKNQIITVKGLESREINIQLEWLYNLRSASPIGGLVHQDVLTAIGWVSPFIGVDDALDFAESDALVQTAMGVKSVLVEDIEIEEADFETGKRKATIKVCSWTKPVADAPTVAATPRRPDPVAPPPSDYTPPNQEPMTPAVGYSDPGALMSVDPNS